MSINLTNSNDLIVNSLSLIRGNNIEDISEIYLSKDEAISGIVGLPVSTLDTLEKIGNSIDNDPNFFANNQVSLNLKSNLAYVNGELLLKKDILSYNTEKDIITNTFNSYQSIASNTILLNDKANQITTYSKTEANTLLNDKANQTTTHTIAQANTLLNAKANQTTTYTKSEVDTIFETLIDSAPIALNQLSELAAALDNDANYASNVNNLIATKANQSTTYTKTEANTLLNAKANQSTTHTIAQSNTFLNAKANQSTTYTKTEANTLINNVLKTGATSVSLKNNGDEDVAIFYNTKAVELKGDIFGYAGLSVLGASVQTGITNNGGLVSNTLYSLGNATVASTLTVGAGIRTNVIIGVDAAQIEINDNVTVRDNLVVSGNLTVAGTINGNVNPYHIAINVSVSGNIRINSGIHNATVSKNGSDSSYNVTFPAHPLGSIYLVLCSSNEYHTVYRSTTATSLILYCRSSSNTSANEGGGAFSLVILA